jgi:hypothetical protein
MVSPNLASTPVATVSRFGLKTGGDGFSQFGFKTSGFEFSSLGLKTGSYCLVI